MANTVVQLDHDNFFRAFLSPPHFNFRAKRASPAPFSQLDCANELPENIILQQFITATRTHHLTPGSTLTTVPFDDISIGCEVKHGINTAIYRSTDVPKRGHAHWADQKVSFQFSRYVAGADPFEAKELDEDFIETGRERKQLRERINAAAELLFAAQQRVFMFMIFIMGRRFRLLRWDRAGVIATPFVDYVQHSALLCDYLRRLSLLDDMSLGFDPTATRLQRRDPDFRLMDAVALNDPSDVDHTERPIEEGEIGDSFVFRYVRSLFRDALSADWPRYRLRVQHGDDARDYLVGKPLHLPSGVVSRGTRGYVALDCETQRFVWLKDVWRVSDLITAREGDILGKLNLAGVANVPTLVCHSDVQDQATATDEWWGITHNTRPGSSSREGRRTSPRSRKRKRDGGHNAEDSSPDATGQASPAITRQPEPCPLRRHTHYRIAVEEVAMPLSEFRCGKQLASIAFDCLHAHHQAATHRKTRLLHRDISSGNMLIYPKVQPNKDGEGQSMCWAGMLTDWELAKPLDVQETPKSLHAHRVVRGIQSILSKHFHLMARHHCPGDRTHQFMSVHLLNNPFEPVKISDELESFFHVLVYFSVLHLRSNCASPNSWINSYFLSFGLPNMYTGGMKSVAIQQDGQLTTLLPQGPLLFHSPMDELLGELIKSFTAHYKMTAHEFRQAFSPGFSSSSGSATSSPGADKTGHKAATAARPKVLVVLPSLSDDPELARDMAELEADQPPDKTPTPEERELARRVADHSFALDFIADLLRRSEWPDDDRIPVRAAPAPQPHREPEPASADVAPAPKRRRRAAPKAKEKATKPAAQPARRPSTTRQTRSQTRAASSKTPLGRKP